jgi:ribosomal protein S18 acetylase RimI-like enzyme
MHASTVINVLPPYQRMGIATALLNHVIEKAQKDPDIQEAYLHVQTSNAEAKAFYVSQQFTEVDVIANYYKNIEPPDCFLLRRIFERKEPETATASETVTDTVSETVKETEIIV